jgi:N6-L-threonylcarbamoyladenine synthase
MTSRASPSSLPPGRILGIESSCDETAAAIIQDGRIVLSSLVASQVELHARFGGVFPEVASRQHILSIYPIVDQALKCAHFEVTDMDAIAVTRGPGLPGSLVVGINTAKGLALASGKPLIGINHLEAHIYSAWLSWPPVTSGESRDLSPAPQFPLVVLIVSGGHTELVLMRNHLTYTRLGATLDDAAGEAFDKVARLLELGYPGGPAIQAAAEKGDVAGFGFPRAWLEGTWNFSFSGLKTAVLRQVQKIHDEADRSDPAISREKPPLSESLRASLAASFQAAVVDVLFEKTLRAAREFSASQILVAGGVSANHALRSAFLSQNEFPVHIPPLELCTDNAAMVAAAGYFRFIHGQRDHLDMDVLPNWPLSEL